MVWGHDTAVAETARDFQGNWYGTGTIANPGVADTECLELEAGEYMISEPVDTGATNVTLQLNKYAAGDAMPVLYRHGATEVACLSATWNTYIAPFASLGFVQVQLSRIYSARILGLGPIAYWPLNETSGTTAQCLVNPLQNGTYSSDVSAMGLGTGPDGASCPYFDGTNDWVDIDTATFVAACNTSTGSIAAWARVDNVGIWTDGLMHHIISIFQNSFNEIFVDKSLINNNVQGFHEGNNNASSCLNGGHSETAWMHWLFTWDVGSPAKLYIDGSLEVTAAANVNAFTGVVATAQIGSDTAAPAQAWHGWLAHVAVFDRVLDVTEAANLAVI